MDKEQTYHQIEAYLDGLLPPEEREAFEQKLRQQPALKEQLDKHRAARLLLEISAGRKLLEEVADKKTLRPFRAGQRWMLWSAAAAVVLLALLWSFMSLKTQYTPQNLAMQHFELYPGSSIRAERAEAGLFEKGMLAYEAGDLDAAIRHFSAMQPAAARYAESRLYLGVALLQNGQAGEAASVLKTLIASNDSRFSPAAQWYLCLAYLMDGQVEASKELASVLAADTRHAYSASARRLLKDMNSFFFQL
ncbi:MAG: hypothetical protein D6730_15885 [Bacteroidetes bacterium]|nr:MAG: hypothetical protein D6730_15885 [Bacteroidota bacterium]